MHVPIFYLLCLVTLEARKQRVKSTSPLPKYLDKVVHTNDETFERPDEFVDDNHTINWTTCDEFAKKAYFHSDDIVNRQWLPFYIWSKTGFSVAVIHRFSYPTKTRVTHYRTSFGPYVKDVDWSRPKLLLWERREILLVSRNRSGLFYGIPDQEVPSPEQSNVILPTIKLRIKIHRPYIAMMYCDEFYSIIMAEAETKPLTRSEKIREASTLGFRGIGVPVYLDALKTLLALNEELRKSTAEYKKDIKILDENFQREFRRVSSRLKRRK